jgi:hypothetical protein
LRDASVETLDALEGLLKQLKSAPYQNSGYIEITAPLDDKKEARWKLEGIWGIDVNIQKAIKSYQSVEVIKEIAA